MHRRAAIAGIIGVLLAACAGGPPPAPPAPPPLDPTGTFDLTIGAQGMTIAAVMYVQGSAEGGYTGSIDSEMGAASITNIRVAGQTLRFSIPDAGFEAEVVFDGDGFSGGMSGAMGEASIIGKKRPPA